MATLTDVRRRTLRRIEVAGRLVERVSLASLQLVDDGHGGFTEAWTPLTPADVFAQIDSLQGVERLQAQAIEVSLAFMVTLRWHDGITAGTRITWPARGLVLEVNGPPVEIVRRQLLQCYCSSRVSEAA